MDYKTIFAEDIEALIERWTRRAAYYNSVADALAEYQDEWDISTEVRYQSLRAEARALDTVIKEIEAFAEVYANA